MKRSNYVHKSRGFTLVELLIVLAILGIVLTVIFSMNLFGIRTFNRSSTRSQNQNDVRMAADFITKQLRYAKAVQITNTPAASTGKNDLYLKTASGKTEILYNKNGIQSNIPGVTGVSDYKLSFEKESDKIIKFTIGKTGTADYDIVSEVTVLNVSAASPITVNSTDDQGVTFVLDESISDADAVAADKAWLSIPNANWVINNLTLPNSGPNATSITWSSSDASVVSNTGIVTQPAANDATLTLTAVISKGAVTDNKIFTITVKKAGTGISIVSAANINASIAQNQPFTMPATAVATMSDGTFKNVSVSWSPGSISTSTLGIKTSEGTISGYSSKISLTVDVFSAELSITNAFPSKSIPRKTSFSYTFTPSGGTEPYTFEYSGLPSWLSSNGPVISGTPSASQTGTSNITVKVSDSAGNSKSYSMKITVTK